MGATYEFNVDAGPLVRKVKAFARDVGVTIQFACHETMALWANDLMKRTYPESMSQGRGAVVKDLNNIFVPVDNEGWLDDLVRESNVASAKPLWWRTKTGLIQFHREFIGQELSKLEDFHQANRNPKTGRTYALKGQWGTPGGKMMVPISIMQRYMKQVWARLGRLKAGWVVGVVYYGGRARRSISIPGWVAKHAPEGSIGGVITNKGDGAILTRNRVPYAYKTWMNNLISFTGRNRQNDLDKWARLRVDRLIARFNAQQAAA